MRNVTFSWEGFVSARWRMASFQDSSGAVRMDLRIAPRCFLHLARALLAIRLRLACNPLATRLRPISYRSRFPWAVILQLTILVSPLQAIAPHGFCHELLSCACCSARALRFCAPRREASLPLRSKALRASPSQLGALDQRWSCLLARLIR